jgi:hypothetical protein
MMLLTVEIFEFNLGLTACPSRRVSGNVRVLKKKKDRGLPLDFSKS